MILGKLRIQDKSCKRPNHIYLFKRSKFLIKKCLIYVVKLCNYLNNVPHLRMLCMLNLVILNKAIVINEKTLQVYYLTILDYDIFIHSSYLFSPLFFSNSICYLVLLILCTPFKQFIFKSYLQFTQSVSKIHYKNPLILKLYQICLNFTFIMKVKS